MATTTKAAGAGLGQVAQELKRPYVPVFVFLGLVTLVEVQIPTLGQTLGISQTLQIGFLIGTAIIKAGLVALYYMHLRYEPRILKILPMFPLVFVALLITTVMAH